MTIDNKMHATISTAITYNPQKEQVVPYVFFSSCTTVVNKGSLDNYCRVNEQLASPQMGCCGFSGPREFAHSNQPIDESCYESPEPLDLFQLPSTAELNLKWNITTSPLLHLKQVLVFTTRFSSSRNKKKKDNISINS